MCQENNAKYGLIAFLAGAAIGAGLGLLFAPQSGRETREKIKEKSGRLAENVKSYSENAVEQVKSFVKGAKHGMGMDKNEDEKKSY